MRPSKLVRVAASPTAIPLALAAICASGGCAHTKVIPGTSVLDTEENRAVISVIEDYRQRLMQKNVDGVLVLASESYFEDSGTPRADDDYGYGGLRQVMESRFARVKALRYDIEYRKIRVQGDNAWAEVFLDGAFELTSESGDRYRRVNDYWQFVLKKNDGKWKFVSGM